MEERRGSSAWETVQGWLAFSGWIVLFLVGPAVPQMLDELRPAEDFLMVWDEPVYFADHAALALEVQNNSRQTERDVEIWSPLPPAGDVAIEADPFGYGPQRFLRIRQQGDYRILGIGDLQPGERYSVSLSTRWKSDADGARTFANFPWVVPKVMSAGGTARSLSWRSRAFRDEMRLHWYSNTLTLLGAALVFLLVLVSRQGREA